MTNIDKILGGLLWIAERMQEASTWNAIAAAFLMWHIGIDPSLYKGITQIGAGVGIVMGFVLKEKGVKLPAPSTNPSPVNVT